MATVNLSSIPAAMKLVSAKYTSDFFVKSLGHDDVTTLSLSGNGQLLLVGHKFSNLLRVYNVASFFLVTWFNLPEQQDVVSDAVWLPRNDSYIMCATKHGVYFMPVMQPKMGYGVSTDNITIRYFSVFHDNVIYATDTEAGVFKSRDGVTWRQAAKNEQRAWHAVRVPTSSYVDTLWVILMTTPYHSYDWFLRIYTISNVSGGENEVWCNVTAPAHVKLYYGKLAYDGVGYIFTTDMINRAVHVWLVNGQYDRQLLSSEHIRWAPKSLAIDMQRQVLYLGQELAGIDVFDLRYE
jgi:hypothetical protein